MLHYKKIEEGIFLVKSDVNFPWKCNGIVAQTQGGENILIDCNFTAKEIDSLLQKMGPRVAAYFASHVHMDHVNNIKNYETLGIKIYCPIPEDRYLLHIDTFLRENGAADYGLLDQFKFFVANIAHFRELNSVSGFAPGMKFTFGEFVIETIPLPGHSPGHTAFAIRDLTNHRRNVLFASDIGLDPVGAWYGFKYNHMKDLRASIARIEAIYNHEDFILTSGHGPIYFEKQYGVFQEIRDKIEHTKQRLLALFDPKTPRGLGDVTLKGVFYRKETVQDLDETFRGLHNFWEGAALSNLIEELEQEEKLIAWGEQKWVLKEPAPEAPYGR